MPAAFSLIGVLHLLPLPAAPRGSPGFEAVARRALADAEALLRGGISTAILENLGDAPFRATAVDPHVPAMMAALGERLRQVHGAALGLGVNVLRNDARAALGVAAAIGARFIRVNVHTGATWTDQGLITGQAHDTLRYRRELGLCPSQAGADGVLIAADVLVKHGVPAGEPDIKAVARETWERGGADVLIVTGRATGAPAAQADLEAVRAAVPEAPLWVGSGLDPRRLASVRRLVHGAIAGTWLHREGRLSEPIDPDRVRAMVDALG